MPRKWRKQNQDFWPIGLIALVAAPLLISLQQQVGLPMFLAGILIICMAVSLVIFLHKRYAERRLSLSGIEKIDRMSGTEFERYLKAILRRRGCSFKRKRDDLGTDLIVCRDGVVWGIQAKRYKITAKVNLDAVRQVATSAKYYKCDRTMVVTSSYFTRNAQTVAKSCDCVLVDRESLIRFILKDGSFLGE
jgi:restriction system protein